eukprot:TRINITY_DN1419_c0_g2_i1.p1 TRINITY_DN1419_c0_g2~~TRINITY_DN1419_c0_g2_i1.p1  ORF type:complete len:297 (+),score=95.84 TRINITY_DN1419_c0_g2_i1:58-891(+)
MGTDTKIEDLVKRNEELRKELIGLNNELNDKLKLRGESLGTMAQVGPKIETANHLYDSPAIKENDKMKRDNARLLRKLRENSSLQEIQVLKDSLVEKENQIRDMKTQNETLEQVTKHQGQGMANVARLEAELDNVQRKHGTEILRLKEELRTERSLRDDVQKQVTANQNKINSLRARITVAKSPAAEKWPLIDQMKQDLEKKEESLQQLNSKIEDTRKEADRDLKVLRKEHREQAQSIAAVQAKISAAKTKVSETEKVLQMSSSPYLWKFQHTTGTQ